MFGAEVALQALSALSSAGVAYALSQRAGTGSVSAADDRAAGLQQCITGLSIRDLVPVIICGGQTSSYRSLPGFGAAAALGSAIRATAFQGLNLPNDITDKSGKIFITPNFVWSKEHLDPRFNYDFSKLHDTKKYSRGDEAYKRPCGWQRFGIKVLDEFDDNTWLGNTRRTTESVPGEWPVSYHGTQEKFVQAIIEENYKAGHQKKYGRGVYSTPNEKIAEAYAVEFTAKGTKYKVVMQNRINPKYREICDNKEYWLVPVPENASDEEEQKIIEKAIRPYGLLLKKV